MTVKSLLLVLDGSKIISLIDKFIASTNGMLPNTNILLLRKDILSLVIRDVIEETCLVTVATTVDNNVIPSKYILNKNIRFYNYIFKEVEYLYSKLLFMSINSNILIDIVILDNSLHLYVFKKEEV